jgi:hypothetical protein
LSKSNSVEGSFAYNCGGKTKHHHMGEMEETDGFVNDREAESYESINTTRNNSIQ